MFYVYLLKSRKSGKLYIGYTEDLQKRFKEHNAGLGLATKPFTPYDLVYYEAFRSQGDAIKREKQLKHFKQGYTRLKERIPESLGEQS